MQNPKLNLTMLSKYIRAQQIVDKKEQKQKQKLNPIQKTMQKLYGDVAIEERKLKSKINKQKQQLKKLQQQKPLQKTNQQIQQEMSKQKEVVIKNTPDSVIIRENQQYNDQQIKQIQNQPFDQQHQYQTVFDTQLNCAYFIYHIQDYINQYKDCFVQITYQVAEKRYVEKEDFYDSGEETVITTKTIVERLTGDLMKKLLDYQNLEKKHYDAMFCPIFSDSVGVGSIIYHAIKFQILQLNEADKNKDELVMIDNKLVQRHMNKGKYFNYYNLTNLDLTKYQIYKRGQKIDPTHCLLFSLKQSKQLSDDELLNIETIMRKTGDFKLKDIKNLNLTKTIQINTFNESKQAFTLQTINQQQKENGIINIVCFKNHYFYNDEVKDYNKIIYQINIKKYNSNIKYKLTQTIYDDYLTKWDQLTYFQKLQCYQFQCENLIQKNYLQNRINKQNENLNKFQIQYNKTKNIISLVDKNNGTKHDAKQLIQYLFNNDFFEEILEYNKYNQKEVDKEEIITLKEIPKCCQKKYKYKEKKHQKYLDIICADFEAFTRDEEGRPLQKHKNFMLCYQSELNNLKQTTTNINYMMNQLMNQYYEKVNENLQAVNEQNNQLYKQFDKLDEKELGQKEYRLQKKQIRQSQNQINLDNTFLIKFYNLSYDAQFIIQSSQQMDNILNMNGKIISFSINQSITNDEGKTVPFVFKFVDNLMLFNQKLSALPKMLLSIEQQKQIYKEIFPYNYYTEKRYKNNIGTIDDAFNDISKQYQNKNITKQNFINSIQKAGALINDNKITDQKQNDQQPKYFNMFKYAEYYCQQDVTVQKQCNLSFQKMVKDEFQLDINDFISISSLSFQYQKDNGVFENVYETSGVLRKYLKQFQVGGRTMTGSNKKWEVLNQKIGDFDAVSLYPSAQFRMHYPAGEAKVLTKEQIDYYNNPENLFKITEEEDSADKNSLYLTCKISKGPDFINKMIPILSQKNEDGTRVFDNELDYNKPFFVTHVTLQDAIKFQHYQYEIISGCYYEERNYTINKVIKQMFQKRLHYKELKNPIQCVYKLCLNSSYGKLIEGLHGSDYEIINDAYDDEENITETGMQALFENLDGFQNAVKINNKLYIETSKAVNDSFNFNQCGVLVLDYSKRIINEVLDVIENLKLPIYYIDTDSQQFPIGEWNEEQKQYENLYKIEQEYKKLYNRELIGKKLGQFHCDFDSELGDVQYADNCIYLGKKAYMCELVVKTSDNKIVKDEHIRMKGINGECIIKKKTDENISTFQLYDKLYNGEEMTFDQCDVKACFKKGLKNDEKFLYTSLDDFERKVSFHYDEGVIGQEYNFEK